MYKKLLKAAISILLLLVVFSGCIEEQPTGIVIEGKGSYTSIQKAIDNASTGDTIFVYNGTYHETFVINKSINLIGEGDGKTIIDYGGLSSEQVKIILVNADNCSISGVKIINTNDSLNVYGINIFSSDNTISNNIILNANRGIHIERNSENNDISQNNISNNQYGIYINSANGNNIRKNNVFLNKQYGIYLSNSNNIIVSDNVVSDSSYGIRIKGSRYNQVFGNIVKNNQKGVYFCCGAKNNTMYYNTFKQNSEMNAYDTLQQNKCDNGSIGNYYDDYKEKYPDANIKDGIWDTPYKISGGSTVDNYPLAEPVNI